MNGKKVISALAFITGQPVTIPSECDITVWRGVSR